jgi:hypothetical protein
MQPFARKISRSHLQSVRTRSSSFQVQVASWAAITSLLHFLATHKLESNLNFESKLLDSPMPSVHWRNTCMGCTARGGEPIFNDYQSAGPPLTMRAAKVAANPVERSRLSPFSSKLVQSTLAMEKPVEEERLARGAPNQRHLVAQVAMISLNINDIIS